MRVPQGSRSSPRLTAIVNHAVESHTLAGIVRQNLKWRYLAYLVKRHPEFRQQLPLGLFWDREHLLTTAAIAGLIAARRDRRFLALAVPYVAIAVDRRGNGVRARVTSALELPGQAVRQTAEVACMAAGSAQHRTALL